MTSPPPRPRPPLEINVFADLVCPWCFIGKRRLQKVLAEFPELEVRVVHRTFLLDPSTPPEGADLRERLRAKYGGNPDEMFGRVEAVAHETGIPLDFSKVRRSVSTLKAHTLLREAFRKGTQLSLSEALYDAYFLQGLDIGQDQVLIELASQHGFTAPEVKELLADENELALTREEAAEAVQGGVQGVPFFVFGDKLGISGAQPESSFRHALREASAA